MQELRSRRADYLAIKNFLYAVNEPLALSLAKRFRAFDNNEDDLHQAAKIGLLRGVERFDPQFGTQFSTLAVSWIKQMLYLEREESGVGPQVPRHAFKCATYLRALPRMQLLGIDREEVCRRFEVSPNVLSGLLHLVDRVGSLNAGMGNEDRQIAQVADRGVAESAQIAEAAESKELIEKLTQNLLPREREIIAMRFGIGYPREHTLQEVGQHLGITRERVRQIEADILETCRKRMRRERL